MDSGDPENHTFALIFEAILKKNIDAGTEVLDRDVDILDAHAKLLKDQFDQDKLEITNDTKTQEMTALERKLRDMHA